MAAATTEISTIRAALNVLTPLKHRNFALLMGGRTTSEAGRMMRVFARGWLVLELTGSPFLLAVVTSAISWPMLVVPLLGGVLADRFDRRKLLLFSEFSLVVLWAVTSLVITLGLIQWWHLLISSVFSGIIQSIGRTGHQAILGDMVDKKELSAAIAINSIAQYWPMAIGLAAATALIATVGVHGLFWITTVGQLITAITLLMFHWEHQKQEAATRSMGNNFVEGLKHVRGQPLIVALLLFSIAGSLIGGFSTVLLPFFARDIFGRGAQGLGLLMTSNSVGVSIGAGVMLMITVLPRRGMWLMITALTYTALLLAFAISREFYLGLAIVLGIGLSSTTSQTIKTMILQLLAPDHLRGRIMSMQVSIQGFSFLGVLAIGAIAQLLGPANAVLIGAGMYGIVSVAIFAIMPSLRRFQ